MPHGRTRRVRNKRQTGASAEQTEMLINPDELLSTAVNATASGLVSAFVVSRLVGKQNAAKSHVTQNSSPKR